MATFYRIIKEPQPTAADFLSHRSRGIPLQRDTPVMRRSWEGVSVYDTIAAARAIVARFPRIGGFIAELDIRNGGPVLFEQTGDDPNHYDLWGEPDDVLAAVTQVFPA